MTASIDFRALFDEWQQSDAKLLNTNTRGDDYGSVDIATAAEHAKELLEMKAQQKDAYVIPLFVKTEPRPTNEYVLYRSDEEQIGWHDSGFGNSGVERFTNCERLTDSEIGHRLRFWLPANQPDEDIGIDESVLPPDDIDPQSSLDPTEQDRFFDELQAFVEAERTEERESNWERYKETGLDDAIASGSASGPFLHVTGDASGGDEATYSFQITVDDDEDDVDLRGDEGLFEGNLCILDADIDHDHLPIPVELLSVDDPQIQFQPQWDRIEATRQVHDVLDDGETEVYFSDLLVPVPYDRRKEALRQVERSDRKQDLITGNKTVRFEVNKYALPESEIDLNEHQQTALVWAHGAKDIVCIHGPPGTGKTRTLTAYVESAVERGQSVLVTAHSNQAVDNLLVGDSTPDEPEEDTLHALACDPDRNLSITRVGGNSRSPVVQQTYMDGRPERADVVAATTSGAAQFDQNQFDVAVVDEATQASRPATAIALNCARKLVLAGDHKQLPPYCADEGMQEEEYHISLFEYLLERYDDEISVLLRTQYRMHKEIAEFSNNAFYDGMLETAEPNRNWTVDGLDPLCGIDIAGGERQQSTGNSYYNPAEAKAVARQVQRLVQNGLSPEDIGVISTYSGQVGTIIRHVNRLDIKNVRRVSVDTVDSFQGSEREAIIVSFVRSNEDGHSGFLEFPEEGPRRLNVALTRPRRRLVLIGDWETLGTVAPHRDPSESCASLYADLSEYLRTRRCMILKGE